MNILNRFFNWVLISSKDPSQGALTVKGLLSLGIVQVVFENLLPAIGVHPSVSLAQLSGSAYDIVFAGLSAISSIVALVGFVRKLANTVAGPEVPPVQGS